MIPYEILATGSKGNAVVLDGRILLDCGVPYKTIEPYVGDLSIVALTHRHGDHFNESTIARLHLERPGLRFACCKWLAGPLSVQIGSKWELIDVMEPRAKEAEAVWYNYGPFSLSPAPMKHDMDSCGWRVRTGSGTAFYATDTGDLDHVEAPGYDLYLLEANHTEEEIRERIAKKEIAGEYVYERRAARYHLSKEQADDWLYSQMGPGSEYVYMHCHEERES